MRSYGYVSLHTTIPHLPHHFCGFLQNSPHDILGPVLTSSLKLCKDGKVVQIIFWGNPVYPPLYTELALTCSLITLAVLVHRFQKSVGRLDSSCTTTSLANKLFRGFQITPFGIVYRICITSSPGSFSSGILALSHYLDSLINISLGLLTQSASL